MYRAVYKGDKRVLYEIHGAYLNWGFLKFTQSSFEGQLACDIGLLTVYRAVYKGDKRVLYEIHGAYLNWGFLKFT